MDRILTCSDKIRGKILKDFNELKNTMPQIIFEVWTEIPEYLQYSYYTNEQIINPVKESFDDWKIKLPKRLNPIYSLAIYENHIISSVYSGEVSSCGRIMNLWSTKPEFRKKGIGSVVLLNLISHCFENNNTQITAWDITSKEVDKVLTSIGFV